MVLSTEILGIKNALAEKLDERAKKAAANGKPKYPNPAFWRAKDNMDWKAQGENLKEVGKICVDMFKEADIKAFCLKQVDRCKNDFDRCVLEVKQGIAMSPEERRLPSPSPDDRRSRGWSTGNNCLRG